VQHDVGVEQVLLDLENQILLSESGRATDLEPVSHLLKLSDRFSLQLRDVHVVLLEVKSRLAGAGGGMLRAISG
jgi:hypothetical protein